MTPPAALPAMPAAPNTGSPAVAPPVGAPRGEAAGRLRPLPLGELCRRMRCDAVEALHVRHAALARERQPGHPGQPVMRVHDVDVAHSIQTGAERGDERLLFTLRT